MKALGRFILALIIVGVVFHPTWAAIIWPMEVAQALNLEANIVFYGMIAGVQLLFICAAIAMRQSKSKDKNKAQ